MKRSKPKRCDFIYKGVRYWLSDCTFVDISDSDDTMAYMTEPTVLEYETDKEPPLELFDDMDFWEKIQNAEARIFPNMESHAPWYQGY
jgi:hypothetical protein